jgi:anti-sigma regulatory factor (Ser/Thr protein kinase)
MGRLRTAVRTLSQLDLPPGTLLRHVNGLADDLAHGPDDILMATCVYAVYDPAVQRVCAVRAGHVPPLLVVPGEGGGDREVRPLDLPAGTPLGIDGASFESAEFEVPDESVLVLYTDGLVEKRGEDITDGIERLVAVLRRAPDDLEASCDAALAGLTPGQEPDDVALLMARLGRMPEDAHACWTLPEEPGSVARARAAVRETLRRWRLTPLEDTAVLLVSELVTNSLRHACGPIGLRLVRGHALLVEVSDPLPEPPRERHVDETAESGRGLKLVARASRRWGTRYSADGKVVWFELPLPGS